MFLLQLYIHISTIYNKSSIVHAVVVLKCHKDCKICAKSNGSRKCSTAMIPRGVSVGVVNKLNDLND